MAIHHTINQTLQHYPDGRQQRAQVVENGTCPTPGGTRSGPVSHDLRTLLASIRVMLESLIDGVVDDHETVKRYLRNTLLNTLANWSTIYPRSPRWTPECLS